MPARPDFKDLETAGPKGVLDYARWNKALEAWDWWHSKGNRSDRNRFKTRFERLCLDGYLPSRSAGRRGGMKTQGVDHGDGIQQVYVSGNWRAMCFREGASGRRRWLVSHFFYSRHGAHDYEIELTKHARTEHLSGSYNDVLQERIQERESQRRAS